MKFKHIIVTMLIAAVWGTAIGQVPANFENGNFSSDSAGRNLKERILQFMDSGTDAWIGYAVTPVRGTLTESRNPRTIYIEEKNYHNYSKSDNGDTCYPEQMYMLYRANGDKKKKIHFHTSCNTIDFGGLPVTWLQGVSPDDSVDLLYSILESSAFKKMKDSAMAAIAFHDTPAADEALEAVLLNDSTHSRKETAAFWLGNTRGIVGVEILKRMAFEESGISSKLRSHITFAFSTSKESDAFDCLIRMAEEDPSAEVRGQALFWLGQKGGPGAVKVIYEALDDTSRKVHEKAVFALSQLPDGQGVDKLIDLAKDHKQKSVRSKALFWLSQKAGEAAADTIVDAISNDPDEEVKEQAVFALSQLPGDVGIEKLLEVAKENKNPNVRKKAIFWLGQSKDPRALELFESILKK